MTDLMPPDIDFAGIRRIGTSQESGFEELCYQLVPTIEHLAPGARLRRHKAPDAGIEFSMTAPTGGLWGWQSKFLDSLDASTYSQMDESFTTAIKHFPDLVRYAFVLPTDRMGNVNRRGESGFQRWDRQVTAWRSLARKRGLTVAIEFIGASDLISALTRDVHRGTLHFFFNRTLLDQTFLEARLQSAIDDLGRRYRPEVNVDLEVSQLIEELARSDRWRASVEEARHRIRTYDLAPAKRPVSLQSALTDAVLAARTANDGIVSDYGFLTNPTTNAAESCRRQVEDAIQKANLAGDRVLSHARAIPSSDDARRGERDASYSLERHIWALSDQLSRLEALLRPSPGDGACLILEGAAGVGKSHLLADVARARLARGAPTVLLLGQHFVAGGVWPQIAQMLGISLDRDDLLQAMSAAAMVADEGRFLILIDGINERHGVDVWADRLAGFLADIRGYPWIAVGLSVRSTYSDVLLDGIDVPRFSHPGLAGHEDEALAKYAAFEGIRVADLPPLLPESTNPLFVATLCRVVVAHGVDAVPRGGVGAAWVFEGLLDVVEKDVARRLDLRPNSGVVRQAVGALAAVMLQTRREELDVAAAARVCNDVLPGRAQYSQTLLYGLLMEGLLIEEHDQSGARVRFAYQRLGDYMLATELLVGRTSDEDIRAAVETRLAASDSWRFLGVLDALSVLVPETLGKELYDVLQGGEGRRGSSPEYLRRQLVASLDWRGAASVTPRTIELAREAVSHGAVDSVQWVEALVRLASLVDHPLNVEWTSARLRELSLTQRDLAWSYPLLGEYEPVQPVERTINWALAHGRGARPETVSLVAELLAWFFTIPNRRTRDRATKALVSLVDGFPAVVPRLVKFFDIDDPYVLERIAAVAYGAALRLRRHAAPDGWQEFGRLLLRHASQAPTHLLTNYYATSFGGLVGLPSAPKAPSTPWPLTAPLRAELEAAYGPDGQHFIIDEWDDFYRYTITGAIRPFVPPDQPSLKAELRQEAVRAEVEARAAVEEALAPLDPDATRRLEDEVRADNVRLRSTKGEFSDVLAAMQRLDQAAFRRDRVDRDCVRVEPDLVARWVSNHVQELGWSHEGFGSIDTTLRRGRSGRAQPVERFGKKYAWISLFECLGNIADHCLVSDNSGCRDAEPYRGPWQLSYVEDIDPSHVMVAPPQFPADAWWHVGLAHDLEAAGSDAAWIRSAHDIPPLVNLLSVRDPSGDDWIRLHLHAEWEREFDGPVLGMSRDRRQLTFYARPFLARIEDRDRIARGAGRRTWHELDFPSGYDSHAQGFIGEYPDRGPWPEALSYTDDWNRPKPLWSKVRGLGPLVGDAVKGYSFSSERDGSIDERSASSLMPSPTLIDLLELRWTPGSADGMRLKLGQPERERSWSNGGRIIAFYADSEDFGGPSALLVHGDSLRQALAPSQLVLATDIRGEKIYWAEGNPSSERLDVFGAAALAPGPLTLWAAKATHGDMAKGVEHRVVREWRA